jgi:glycosyltransferase involved in cell wall biosynthesis
MEIDASREGKRGRRLLFLTPAYAPLPGGGERYVAALAEELAGRGFWLTVVTSAAERETDFWHGGAPKRITETVEGNIRLVRLPLRRFPGGRPALFAWRKLMVMLSALPGDQSELLARMATLIPPIQQLAAAVERLGEEYDLIHAFNISWEHTLIVAADCARKCRLPFVVTPFTHLGTNLYGRVARNSTMDHQLRALRQAGVVFTLTAAERDGLAHLGISAERMVVAGSGVDDPPPDAPDSPLVTSVKHCFPYPYAIFVGRASHDKGALHAAEAILTLRNEGIAVGLVVVGQPTPEFRRLIDNLPAAGRDAIYEAGVVDEADKHALLRRAAVLLLPSRVDSFGIVLLEAWSHGVPVIAARAGGIPAVVDHNENGLLVDFGDIKALAGALRYLLADEAEQGMMGNRGQKKVGSHYTWRGVANQVLLHYSRLVN